MANVNSSIGWSTLPTQLITTTSATALVVPPASALYPGLPSPVWTAGSALYVTPAPNWQTNNPASATVTYLNDYLDGRQFKIRLVGAVVTGVASTFVAAIYQGTSTTIASDNIVAATTSYSVGSATTVNFWAEWNLIWDSTSTKLNGTVASSVNNTWTAPAAVTSVTIATPNLLQFLPVFTFGTANAANGVTLKEFLVETV